MPGHGCYLLGYVHSYSYPPRLFFVRISFHGTCWLILHKDIILTDLAPDVLRDGQGASVGG